ncbi:MAG TPA: TonB-dependent receptor, partial [Planctomycetota bacterium]|nr:TonB-dependent receptor [Planctomycetota bacterium]
VDARYEAYVEAEAALESEDRDFASLSLEELMNLEVTVASRVSEGFMGAPAAVYVITGDELRRSGFTTLPEAMRMVPGFFVAQWYASAWDLTSRGFSAAFSNQLLVMIDGVSVYTPLYAGVFWELQAIPISQVDRIEVIRGPGASLWGANAVNGIINVVTKNSADTQGALISGTIGSTERIASTRYGFPISEHGTMSVWVVGQDFDGLVDADGEDDPFDDWGILKGGFRADWSLPDGDVLRLQGNVYTASIGEGYGVSDPLDPTNFQFVLDDTPKVGFSLLGAWEFARSESSNTRLQAWYSRDNYKQVDFEVAIDQFDVEFQQTHALNANNDLIWGVGSRFIYSDLPGDFTLTFEPESRTQFNPRVFVQDQWRVPAADLTFVLGASLEDNTFTGIEFQPTARIAWQPTERQTWWGAVSRAVRTPSIVENDRVLNIQQDFAGNYLTLLGSDDVVAEDLLAYELGWRWRPSDRISLDLAGFVNDYDNLITIEDGTPFTDGINTFFPLVVDNKGSATAWGFEAAVDVAVTRRWKLRSAYTLFYILAETDADSTDPIFTSIEDSSPKNQANLRSYLDLGDRWELDLGVYYVDHVEIFDTPSYLRADARLGFNPEPGVAFSIGVQNAFDPHHPEDNPPGVSGFGTEVERNVYMRLTLSR